MHVSYFVYVFANSIKKSYKKNAFQGVPNTLKRKRPHLQILKTLKVMHYLSALLMGVLALDSETELQRHLDVRNQV